MSHAENSAIMLERTVEPQFAPVRDEFFAGFEQELGAAVAVYQRGKLVVALAAGLRTRGSETTYSRNTLQPIFSATKGITALAANMLSDRDQLDLWCSGCRLSAGVRPSRKVLDPGSLLAHAAMLGFQITPSAAVKAKSF